ncbi:MAG TPA: c-type cytochrome, partial [Candidatus Baltobacteraceae bacterium]
MKRAVAALAFAAAAVLAGCGGADPHAVPSGPVGDQVRYGYELIVHTRAHLRRYITANMDCAACHVAGGTKAHGGSFVGIAAQFPQWNSRAKRVISLQDRLAECFLYSMNGHPPAYNSREIEAMVAYITYLSRGAKIGSKPDPAVRIAH